MTLVFSLGDHKRRYDQPEDDAGEVDEPDPVEALD